MDEYVEVNDVAKLSTHSRELEKRLRSAMRYKETRTIGFPGPIPDFTTDVHFVSNRGDDVFWWAGGLREDGTKQENFFGRGKPGHNATTLNIEMQINIPVKEFSRRTGGAFLRHLPTNKIVVAHRGIVTLGHGRVQRSELFAEMCSTLREARCGDQTREFLLVGEMDSSTLVYDIELFSTELRRTVQALGKRNVTKGLQLDPLSNYFDEFSGKRKIAARKGFIADCYHGTIVRTLRDFFAHYDVRKDVLVDLAVFASDRILLFEAKTASDRQSIYTATGQLAVHALGLKRYAAGKPIIKVMILPELPSPSMRKVFEDNLDMRVLTFTRSDRGLIKIKGLENLLT